MGEVDGLMSNTAACTGIKASWSFHELKVFLSKYEPQALLVCFCSVLFSSHLEISRTLNFPFFSLALGCLYHEPSKFNSDLSVSKNILAPVSVFFLFIIKKDVFQLGGGGAHL